MLLTSSEELKKHIGFIYLANKFENMKTYIAMAERDIIRLIGKSVYELAADYYTDQPEEDPNKELLEELISKIQLPVALHAYRRYAPGADLSHSEAGRQIHVTETEKPAFEWMIRRDNANILDLAHEATDMLLEWLDEQLVPVVVPPEEEGGEETEEVNIVGEAWGSSTEYEATKSLLISSALQFDAVYPINASRRLYLTLVPFIREVEKRFIEPAITTARYEEIKENIADLEALDADEEKILDLARVPIALMTMSIALKRLSMELLPDSVVQNYTTGDAVKTNIADSADRRGLSALLERDARRELVPLQAFIASLNTETVEEDEETDSTQPFFMA
jgi:hypothetical protein